MLLHALGTQPVPTAELHSNRNGAACVVGQLRHVGVGTPHGPVRNVGRGRSFRHSSYRSQRLAHLAIGTEEQQQGQHAANNSRFEHSEPAERGAVAMIDTYRLNFFYRNPGKNVGYLAARHNV